MKKQTKSSKAKTKKVVPASKQVVVVHSRRQKFFGFLAFVGLFACGLFVGMSIKTTPVQTSQNAQSEHPVGESVVITEPQDVCVEVERLLKNRLPDATDDTDNRIDRAKVYASLAERGCPENSTAYVELAKQELQIARAIEDDEFNHQETIEVVETYKRLHMQSAAEEIFEKAKKLTNPAIDFIIEVEKIINE